MPPARRAIQTRGICFNGICTMNQRYSPDPGTPFQCDRRTFGKQVGNPEREPSLQLGENGENRKAPKQAFAAKGDGEGLTRATLNGRRSD